MKATVHVPCPYCGVVNKRAVDIFTCVMGMQVWHCDCEIGGCEQPFGVVLMAQPQARTYKIGDEKILGAVDFPKKETPLP